MRDAAHPLLIYPLDQLKPKTKTKNQIFFSTLLYTLKKKTFFSPSVFLSPLFKAMYKKVVKFSFTKQKIFWVLVFSFMYLVSIDPMDRLLKMKSSYLYFIAHTL